MPTVAVPAALGAPQPVGSEVAQPRRLLEYSTIDAATSTVGDGMTPERWVRLVRLFVSSAGNAPFLTAEVKR